MWPRTVELTTEFRVAEILTLLLYLPTVAAVRPLDHRVRRCYTGETWTVGWCKRQNGVPICMRLFFLRETLKLWIGTVRHCILFVDSSPDDVFMAIASSSGHSMDHINAHVSTCFPSKQFEVSRRPLKLKRMGIASATGTQVREFLPHVAFPARA